MTTTTNIVDRITALKTELHTKVEEAQVLRKKASAQIDVCTQNPSDVMSWAKTTSLLTSADRTQTEATVIANKLIAAQGELLDLIRNKIQELS